MKLREFSLRQEQEKQQAHTKGSIGPACTFSPYLKPALHSKESHSAITLQPDDGIQSATQRSSYEVAMLMIDVDRSTQRAPEAQRESLRLREFSAAMDGSRPATPPTPKDSQDVAQLLDELRQVKATVDALQESSAKQIAQLEKLVKEKSRTIQQLEEQLERQKDYDDLKTQLRKLHNGSLHHHQLHHQLTLTQQHLQQQQQQQHLHLVANELNPLAILNQNQPPVKREDGGGESPRSTDGIDDAKSDENERGRLQHNVEAFGSLLGEEIVSKFSRMLKREASEPGVVQCVGQASPPATPKSHDDMSSGTEGSGSRFGEEHAASLERLQECLRQNVDKYQSEALNTGNIARCVRELLSVHNIGQRLFAKYVLGLSQGTVSELLSKPKPWDKLTEKGRDSYRKMHAWATDENCIMILKALVPRKGSKETPSTPVGAFRHEDLAEDRIVQILSEAQQAMITPMTPKKEEPDSDTADSPQNLSKKKDDNDQAGIDLPPEILARIYQEEFAKMVGQRVEESFRNPASVYDRSQDEIRQALSIYHQEFSRLSQFALTPGNDLARLSAALPGALFNGINLQAMADPRGREALERQQSAFSMVQAAQQAQQQQQQQHQQQQQQQQLNQQHQQAHQQQARKYPAQSPPAVLNVANESEESNPLQRMQSITNSLLTQSAMPSLATPSPRQAKAVLPPITQQQFDKYNNLNTEDIVKKVKEQLSQYSISQRLFGESVLGLSQGSVSDLLARPKPWHMLTQKGREPFIRMKIFLEDEQAVHKLVASQYKIAPEKLMRTAGFTAAAMNKVAPVRHHQFDATKNSSIESLQAAMKEQVHLNLTPPAALAALQRQLPPLATHSPSPTPIAATAANATSPLGSSNNNSSSNPNSNNTISSNSNNLSSGGGGNNNNNNSSNVNNNNNNNNNTGSTKNQPAISNNRSSYMQPSVYEMAALTTDLDTQVITARIKETLMAHNIGQKIFGEAVLGLSQGSVSELLSKPKPWHMLSIKGREPFIRMQLWLSDPHNVDKLQALKNERREDLRLFAANKRRRGLEVDFPRMELAGFPFPSPNSPFPAAKKPRVLFSDEQKEALRLAFSMDPYPNQATIEFLANELNLSVRTITNWFHNHRMRLKQHCSPNPEDPRPPELNPAMRDQGNNFDPVAFRSALVQRLRDIQSGDRSASRNSTPPAISYNNSYSPSSTNDEGTLDLSMATGHGGKSDNEDSQEPTATEGSDRDSLDGATQTNNKSSSSRRKPAMPKWIDPGLNDLDHDEPEQELIINGVCRLNSSDLRAKTDCDESIVRIEPVAAPDDLSKKRQESNNNTDDIHGVTSGAASDDDF